MSAQAQPIKPGFVGWLGYLVGSARAVPGAYRDALAQRPRRTILLTALIVFGLIYPVLNKEIFQPWNRQSAFPLPFPEDSIVTFMMIFAIMAIGLNIVAGFAGLLDLGYVAFYALGAYTAAFFASPHFGSVTFILFSQAPPGFPGIHLPFWILVPLGFIVAATFGVLLGAPTLRLRGDYLAIVTLGFGEIVPVVFKNLSAVNFELGPIKLVNANLTGGNLGINPIDPPRFFGISFGSASGIAAVYLGLILLLVAIVIARNLEKSRMGRAWMAIREDEIAAEMMGVNPVRTKLLAFGLGASFAGMAGVMQASYQGITTSDFFQFSTSILVLIMIILGGIGNIWGVIVGAIGLIYVDRTLLPYLGLRFTAINPDLPNPSQFNFLIFGILLVVMMRFRPEGFIPNRQRAAELRHAPPGQAIGSAAVLGEEALADEALADKIAAEQEAEVLAETEGEETASATEGLGATEAAAGPEASASEPRSAADADEPR
jgi:branched-chain amino acid transport system permease protein